MTRRMRTVVINALFLMCMYSMGVIHVHVGAYYYEILNLQVVACKSDKAYSGRQFQ